MNVLSEIYIRVGGGLFAAGFFVAVTGMLLTILPELIHAEKRRARLGVVSMTITIVGVALMLAGVVMG